MEQQRAHDSCLSGIWCLNSYIHGKHWRQSDALETLGNFESSKPNDIWFLKCGNEVTFHVEGDCERDRECIATVLVYANLCTNGSGAKGNDEEVHVHQVDGTHVNGRAVDRSAEDEYDLMRGELGRR